MPPSINKAYRNVPGKGRVKSTAYRNFEAEIRTWVSVNAPRFMENKRPLALYLYFYNLRGKFWTLDGRIKQWDGSNRVKLIEDAIARMLGFDDSHFFEHHGFKCVSTRAYVDCLISDALIDKPGLLKLTS